MLERIQAIAADALTWCAVWALAGVVVAAGAFFLHRSDLELAISLENALLFGGAGLRFGGPMGLAAGAGYGITRTIFPPPESDRVSRAWALACGVALGAAVLPMILDLSTDATSVWAFGLMCAAVGAGTVIITGGVVAWRALRRQRPDGTAPMNADRQAIVQALRYPAPDRPSSRAAVRIRVR